MTVFGCRSCDATLTVPVSRVALPVHADQKYGNGPGSLAPALEPGTFAVDPLPAFPGGKLVGVVATRPLKGPPAGSVWPRPCST